MKIFLLLHLLASSDLFAYQEVTHCESKFVKKQWREYESARQYVQALGIKTSKQFREWSHSGKRPEDIPSNPNRSYKSEWINWNEFLGTEKIIRKKNFRSYGAAQALMKELGIETQRQFHKWSHSGERPLDFPSNPRNTYKSEWKSWGEFFGTNNVHKKDVRSYESAKKYAQAQGIKN